MIFSPPIVLQDTYCCTLRSQKQTNKKSRVFRLHHSKKIFQSQMKIPQKPIFQVHTKLHKKLLIVIIGSIHLVN